MKKWAFSPVFFSSEQIAPEEKLWTLWLLAGGKLRRPVNTTLLKDWAAQTARIPAWLFDECYQTVGDLAETVSLLAPEPEPFAHPSDSLPAWINRITQFASTGADESGKSKFLQDCLAQLAQEEFFIFVKLLTGGFRIGVSKTLLIRALSQATGVGLHLLTHRLTGDWSPETLQWNELLAANDSGQRHHSQPYPFFLASPIEGALAELGDAEEWLAEWKWDGIRGQMIIRQRELFLWSRGEELVTERFPELHSLAELLPDGVVLDGEILCHNGTHPLPFAQLQKRITRKSPPRKLLGEAPVVFLAYDLLEFHGKDIREQPLVQRRKLLSEIVNVARSNGSGQILLSPEIAFQSWDELGPARARSRAQFAEGLMLKRKSSPYLSGRKKGDWWKWKVDPLSVDGVLVNAQKGHGRRAGLYTDYTFAVWHEGRLVPFAKAYSGLTDGEIRQVDAFIKKNTLEKFGPVRTVSPELVFEIGFEGVCPSPRHKSGVATRFPRILRWRQDKKPEEADSLETLKKLLKED